MNIGWSKELVRARGTYVFHIKNIQTGQKREIIQHNLIGWKFAYQLFTGCPGSGRYGHIGGINALEFGSGSVEPSASDRGVTTYLWSFIPTCKSVEYLDDDYHKMRAILEIVIPATQEYVANITEVAAVMNANTSEANDKYDYVCFSHALLMDAEGNPISIEKTDLDEITVNYILDLEIGEPTGIPLVSNLVMKPQQGNTQRLEFARLFQHAYTTSGNYSSYTDMLSKINSVTRLSYCFICPAHKKDGKLYQCGPLQNPYSLSALATGASGPFYSFEVAGKLIGSVITTNAPRLDKDIFNIHYLHYAIVGYTTKYLLKLFDSNVFPLTTLTGMSVGTGDGETTEFKPPLNFWVQDSETIYVDDTPLVRNVDYICDHYNNLDKLCSLFPSTNLIPISGVLRSDGSTPSTGPIPLSSGEAPSDNSTPMSRFEAERYDNNYVKYTHFLISTTVPYVFMIDTDGDSERDWSFDTMVWAVYNWSESYGSHYNFILEGSNDGETFELIANKLLGELYYNYIGNNMYGYKLHLDDPVNYQYYKISVTKVEGDTSSWDLPTQEFRGIKLFRTGQNIIFTNPPAQGAIIKMDAVIDRPLKNNKHVLETAVIGTM